MCVRLRCILLSLMLLACGGQCGHPTPGPGEPAPAVLVSTSDPDSSVDPITDAPDTQAGALDAGSSEVETAVGDGPGQEPGSDEVVPEPFDEQAALAALKFKKVPGIPKFNPSKAQEVADPEELEYLRDHERTNKILAEGPWAKVDGEKTLVPMKRVRVNDGISYRFRILVGEDDEIITGFFKPRQANYWDWLKEYHAYDIGTQINAPTVPLVMRYMPKSKFSNFLAKIPQEEQDNFKWDGPQSDQLRGVFKYWVPGYKHRTFGSRVIGETYMTEIATSLHPANKKVLRDEYDLYLQLGRGIVFDYLILNEDRPENLGTILLPDGHYEMVLIDNGLALGVEHGGRTVMKNMFKQMKIFPRDMIEKIEGLEKSEIEKSFRPDDKVMWLPEVIAKQLWKRRQYILDHVEKYHQMYGDVIWY